MAKPEGIPPDALERAQTIITQLEQSFRPLTAKLPFTLEPAINLSESAVLGE